jgi:hypothetical protein
MNERIETLAKAAGYDMINKAAMRALGFDVEKFAELIVRECIKSTLSLHDTAIDNQWNLDETFHMIVDKIVEDFDMQYIFRS